MAKFGEKTRKEITEQVTELLKAYEGELHVAYLKHGDKFKIGFSAIIEPSGSANVVKTELTFRPEPDRKDSAEGVVDEDQQTIPFPEEEAA